MTRERFFSWPLLGVLCATAVSCQSGPPVKESDAAPLATVTLLFES